MKNYIFTALLLLFVSSFETTAQNYKVEYQELSTPLLEGEVPTICIIEDADSKKKLYDELVQSEGFTNKFTCYSSEVITDLKDELGFKEINAENEKFLQSVKEQLLIDYVLDWKNISDSVEAFQLNIYSTKNYKELYSGKFYYSLNSDPFSDIKKLLIDNMKSIYFIPSGEIEISANPESAHFKLLKGEVIVAEWTGKEKQKVNPGTYKLVAEAEKFIPDQMEVEILEGKTSAIDVRLKPDLASMFKIYSLDGLVKNIRTEMNGDQLKILFDLVTQEKEEYDVELQMINKLTKKANTLKMISGDLVKVKPGTNRTVNWQVINELGNAPLNDDNEIRISLNKRGGMAWYYYAGGGAALIGGALVILSGGGGDDGNTTERQKIGTPPGRP